MKRAIAKQQRRKKRKLHIRKKIAGTPERPRMSVFRSNKHMYVQVIDDKSGTTIAQANTLEKEYRHLRVRVADAEKLGQVIGERLKKADVTTVVFDRNGYLYHGVVKAIADGARKTGIEF
jgi:large subunit ribosomal protein L18